MASAISNVHSVPAAQPSTESVAKPAAQKSATQSSLPAAAPSPTTARDTVQVSSAAKALLQESQESSAQTAREANSGDQQAIRLQAKRAASKAHIK